MYTSSPNDNLPSGQPTILGCGLTGMAISRALAREGIQHVLIGPPPTPVRRLGESLNLEGSLDIEVLFPELREHFLPKSAVVSHVGDELAACDLDVSRTRAARLLYRLLGFPPPRAFLHLDRASFDPAVFASIRTSPLCHPVDAEVKEIDVQEDRVTRIALRDGRELMPSHVFDATNHARLLARALDLPLRFLGTPQRLIHAHWLRPPEATPDRASWFTTTHVVRLDAARDGVDGMGWLIPLAEDVSVGLSVDADDPVASAHDERALLDLLSAALARRGLDLASSFVPPATWMSIPAQRYFMHERAFGANWLLAGGSFCQVWFATASGVAAGLAAASCAPHFLRSPQAYGMRYQNLMRSLENPHGVFEWLRRRETDVCQVEELERRATALVRESVVRLGLYAGVRSGALRRGLGATLAAVIRRDLIDFQGICRSTVVPLERQANTVHELVTT